MNPDYERLMNDALAEYSRRREQSLRTQQDLDALAETVLAPRQVVEVTVDGQGRLTSIRFPTHAYKSMPAPELAKVIMKTLTDATDRVRVRTEAVLSGTMPAHVDVRGLVRGQFDPRDLLSPDLAAGGGSLDPFDGLDPSDENGVQR